MIRQHWRHFSPRRISSYIRQSSNESDVFTRAQAIVDANLAHSRRLDENEIERAIESLKQRSNDDPAILLALFILQSPRAARAQQQMDIHPHGYHNKSARLYELIDFNDTYVASVLALAEDELAMFNDRAKRAIDAFCRRAGSRCFDNEQWEAITYGLSREVAVYRGALKEGLGVRMTSRTEDAKGIDMIITDTSTQRFMNVDIKTASSYHFRLKDLVREGRISSEECDHAERVGYCRVVNGRGDEGVEVVLLRVDRKILGDIVDFEFENSHLLGREIRKIVASVGRPI